ncbi:MAG: peptidoglycan DD-metalloendopeptidase family protein [Lachnospiraceae bacterium]|nr:peptidoglycan DD-metalloendopeptidase family protein [Lachnospiraceae bacterium]
MKKRLLGVWVIICIILISAHPVVTIYADKEEEEDSSSSSSSDEGSLTNDKIKQSEQAKNQAQQEKQALAAGKEQAKAIIASLEEAKGDAEAYITQIDSEITNLQEKIDALKEEIEKKQEEIRITKEELEENIRIQEEQYEYMKMRVKVNYEGRKQSILEALFTSKSISELLNRSLYLEEIARFDSKKLEEYKETVKAVEDKAAQLAKEEEELQATLNEAAKEQETQQALMEDKETEVAQYSASIGDKEAQLAEYDAMIAEQNAVIAAMEAAIKAERERLAEEARKYGGGPFTHPCPDYTRVSDEYGMRMHPTLGVEKMHNGIDFAAPTGTPILAAAEGKVIAAAYSPSMGNYVMIDHGSDLITIYMHASSLNVSTGDEVSKGQTIAKVGSTGRSTGPHLHFGVRENGAYVNPSKYL